MKDIISPIPGKIVQIDVKVGDQIDIGQRILLMESMKMEVSIESEERGIVREIKVEVGSTVLPKQVVVIVE